MNDDERKRIGLTLDDLEDVARLQLDSWRAATRLLHRAGSPAQTATLKQLETAAREFILDGAERVKGVRTDADSFEMLRLAVERHLAVMQRHTASLTSKSVFERSVDFEPLRIRLLRILELQKHEFVATAGPAHVQTTSTAEPSKRGRPPKAYWDDVWSTVAADLYTGQLKPTKQADIERAMHERIALADQTASTSTVRKRAELLWRLIRD